MLLIKGPGGFPRFTLAPNRTEQFRFNYESVQSLDTIGKTRIGQKDQVQTEKLNRRFESLKLLTPIQKMSSSQSCSHRTSVQNAPIESSTAITVTLFVKNPKFDLDPKTCRHHEVVRTEIPCRMHRSRAPQLSRRPFS